MRRLQHVCLPIFFLDRHQCNVVYRVMGLSKCKHSYNLFCDFISILIKWKIACYCCSRWIWLQFRYWDAELRPSKWHWSAWNKTTWDDRRNFTLWCLSLALNLPRTVLVVAFSPVTFPFICNNVDKTLSSCLNDDELTIKRSIRLAWVMFEIVSPLSSKNRKLEPDYLGLHCLTLACIFTVV